MVCASLRSAVIAAVVVGVAGTARAELVAEERATASLDPMVAVVSLKEQTIALYDSSGLIRSSSVSSGLASNPTPIGIFSILEKRKEHWSNIYDAEMPHMQRLTWSGIALHEGRVTGRPASHGCVRLPAAVAEDLFGLTRVGMRVIIAQRKTEPIAVSHSNLFVPQRPVEVVDRTAAADRAIARKAAYDLARNAAKTDEDLKKGHAPLLAVVGRLSKAVDAAEREVKSATRAEHVARTAADDATTDADRERLAKVREAATIKRVASEARFSDAGAAAKAKRDAASVILTQAEAAEAAAKSTWEAYRKLARIGEPVSVLVSAKSGLLQVRQAFDPIFELPISIADRGTSPIGTHVFTLMATPDGQAGTWMVVTLPDVHDETGSNTGLQQVVDRGPADTFASTSAQALDRLVIPADARSRIEAVLVPGSSLIVTDEAPSTETGKGTDFVIELNQPQPEVPSVRDSTRDERPVRTTTRSQVKASTPGYAFGPPTHFQLDR